MTGQSLVTNVMTDLNIIGTGETPSAEESAYVLGLINDVLDSWGAEALPIYQIVRDPVSMLGVGTASYALATRPVKIKAAHLESAGIVAAVKLVSSAEWALGNGTASFPHLWSDAGYPTTTVYIRPTMPSGPILYLDEYRPLTSFAELATDVTFPPGYALALRRAVSLEIATAFGKPIDQNMTTLANNAKQAIVALNVAVLAPPTSVGPTAGG